MKRNLLLLILVLVAPLMLMSQKRSQSEALSIAKDYFDKSQGITTRAASAPVLVAVSTDFQYNNLTRAQADLNPAFYIFNQGDDSFVIVSGDDRMKPILGYSTRGAFMIENIPANIRSFLASYVIEMSEIDYMQTQPKQLKVTRTTSYPTSVTPLLGDIMYNQSAPYYDKCPDKSVTGCVATAMAQVMKYHEYPTQGQGTHSYKSSTEGYECSFDYGATTFDWANMLNQYVTGEYTTTQADAIATLMYACGVSVNMNYTSGDSGASASSVANSLIKYFKYDENMAFVLRTYFEYDEWMDMIKNELSNARPILYSGISSEGGHEFVFDGYDANDMVHVNWGWAGANDGYFVVSELDPSSPGIGGGTNLGGGYTSDQGMTIGIQKPTSTSTYTSYFYCSGIDLSSTSVALGSSLKPTINYLINMSTTFDGELAYVLEQSGVVTPISPTYKFSETIDTETGFSAISWNSFNLPTSLADGTYVFYAATRNPDKNTNWDEVRGSIGSTSKYYCTIANGEATFTSYWGTTATISAEVEVVHALYSGRTASFTLTYQNNSSTEDFYGDIYIALMSGDNVESILSTNSIYIAPGQAETTVDISTTIDTLITVGSYTICPLVQWSGSYTEIGTPVSATINAYSGTATMSINSLSLVSSTIEEGDDLQLVGVFEATGTAPVFDGTVQAVVAYESNYETVVTHSQYVFFNVGDTYNFSMSFNPQLSAGNYIVALFVDGSQDTNAIAFTVSAATGIEDGASQQNDKVIVYPQPAAQELFVRAPSDIYKVEIYNVAGQLLHKESMMGSKSEFSLPVGAYASGSYILVLHANDKIYRQKFVK